MRRVWWSRPDPINVLRTRDRDFAHAHTRDQKALRVPDSAEESLAIQVSFFFGRPGPGRRFGVVVSRTDAQAPTGRNDV